MAIRFTVKGVQFEVDTAQEAMSLMKALSIDSLQLLPATFGIGTATRQAQPERAMGLPISPAETIFRNGHSGALRALIAAGRVGIDTTQLLEALGLANPKQLPPVVGAWKKRAANVGLDLSNLLHVEKSYLGGHAKTKYALTEEGMKIFSS